MSILLPTLGALGSILASILHFMWTNLIEFMLLIGGLSILGFVLGLIEKRANQNFVRAFGNKGLLATALVGTPIHELSHLIMCLIFKHKVDEVSLLRLRNQDGVLGYVSHSYNQKSLYQSVGNFFIGVAPILGGIAAILGSMAYFAPKAFKASFTVMNDMGSSHVTLKNCIPEFGSTLHQLVLILVQGENFHHVGYWVFLVLSICIASHISLSKTDLDGAVSGISAIYGLLVFVNMSLNFFGLHIGIQGILLRGNIYLMSLGCLALLFACFTICLSVVFRFTFGLKRAGKDVAIAMQPTPAE